jgi:hypothetical protein
MPGMASWANLIAVRFAVPVQGHVQAQGAHSHNQHDGN